MADAALGGESLVSGAAAYKAFTAFFVTSFESKLAAHGFASLISNRYDNGSPEVAILAASDSVTQVGPEWFITEQGLEGAY